MAEVFGRQLPAGRVIGESWEVCDRPDAVSVVASAIQKGTSMIRANVRANNVLPEPVGPISSTLLFSISTSAKGSICTAVSVPMDWLWRMRL